MNKNIATIYLIMFAGLLGIFNTTCTNKSIPQDQAKTSIIDSLIPFYSHSFRVDYYKGFKVVKVFSGKDKSAVTSYVLLPKGNAINGFEDAERINFPASRIACMSTTHVGALKLLDARHLIVAATNKDLIYDSMVRAMINAGTIKDAGKDYQPDYEAIAQTKPDLLFSDGENTGSSQMYAKMKALGVNIVCSLDYFEQEPLARAEWIKFFATFIGKEKIADSIFKVVAEQYKNESENHPAIEKPVTVFCNLPYSGVWYMPCGENYVAKLIKDAGADFLWDKDKPTNGLNLTLNFEQVYQRAADADFWINTNTFTTLKEIETMDAKFRLFKAFKTGKVFNGVKRASPAGGMDIWETGSYLPNIVLHDLNLIFYSHDSPEDSLYYYKQLK
jgi:iron complex transport system substrate-binding protein